MPRLTGNAAGHRLKRDDWEAMGLPLMSIGAHMVARLATEFTSLSWFCEIQHQMTQSGLNDLKRYLEENPE